MPVRDLIERWNEALREEPAQVKEFSNTRRGLLTAAPFRA